MSEIAPILTFETNEVIFKIYTDLYPIDPRKDCDHIGTMVCKHRKYTLGDVQMTETLQAALYDILCEIDTELSEKLETLQSTMDPGNSKIKKLSTEALYHQLLTDACAKYLITLPLYLYDHSGITISTTSFNDRWDSGCVGFIYAKISDVLNLYGWDELTVERNEQVLEYLKDEVEVYDQYLRGDVYRFTLTEQIECLYCHGDERIHDCLPCKGRGWFEGEEIDAVCSFYGDNWTKNGILDYIDAEKYPEIVTFLKEKVSHGV